MWQSRKYQKQKISYVLETAPTHATDYDKKGFESQNSDNDNTSAIEIKKIYECFYHLAWEPESAKSITLCMLWRILEVII